MPDLVNALNICFQGTRSLHALNNDSLKKKHKVKGIGQTQEILSFYIDAFLLYPSI